MQLLAGPESARHELLQRLTRVSAVQALLQELTPFLEQVAWVLADSVSAEPFHWKGPVLASSMRAHH